MQGSGGVAMGSECPYPYRPMPDEVAMQCARGDIVLQDVSFSYPMRPDVQVLHNVGFTIARGQVTALVGRSGAGKSTVVSLLSRFYAPCRGTVCMGGMDIFAWSRDAWSASVALVAQDPVLFAATIADNIAYGSPRASEESITAAAKAANAHDFIMKLPEGYVAV
jgi:ABC-type multidrug transport system fused ATPase/permease subunit